MNLSNASRVEAIKTFEQLSARISQPSLALSATKSKLRSHRSSKSKNAAASQTSRGGHEKRSRPTHSRSAPELSINTAPEPATAQWAVRPKAQKRKGQINPGSARRKSHPHVHPKSLSAESVAFRSDGKHSSSPSPPLGPSNRMSIMSFASDSTKIGEIPERKGAQRSPDDDQGYLANTVFPLAPWKRPEKSRSRFMRLFRK